MDDVLPGSGGDYQFFTRARRLGFAGVEIGLRRERPERLESLRRARAASGLPIASLVLGEHSDFGGISDGDAAVAERAAADVLRAIDWAAELGADALLVPFFGRAELIDDADVERAAAAFRPLTTIAAERGVELLYEGTLPAAAIKALAARVGSRVFGCYFDLANVVARGMDSATELRALGDLVRRVHFKDVRAKVGDAIPGRGRVDFAESARALAEIGYTGWVVLETPPGLPELVGRDLAFARTVFPQLDGASAWPRLGIFTYELDDWDALIETCRRLGLECVQLGTPLLEEALERPERVDALGQAGIAVAGIAGYRNLIAPDERIRRENVEFLGRCLELAPRLGTSIVATESGTRSTEGEWHYSPENRTPASWRLFEQGLGELVEAAERHGSILALEGTAKHVLGTYSGLDRILDRYPSRHLQAVLDPYNYLSSHLLPAQERLTGDFLDHFEHRFVLAHLKDVGEGGSESSTPEFGTGVFAQRPYLRFLAERRPDLPLILEHLPLEHVAAAARCVRAMSP